MGSNRYTTVRANGGFLLHLLPPKSRIALCGHKPSGRTSKARWVQGKLTPSSRLCEKCQAVKVKREQVQDTQA